jgi:hypothetical protein
MFTTNLSIIIITGTGAGHEPQTKVQGLRKAKLNCFVVRSESAHARNWGHKDGLPPVYHPGLYSPHKYTGFGSVDGTHDEQKSPSPSGAVGFYPGVDSSSIEERQGLHPGERHR